MSTKPTPAAPAVHAFSALTASADAAYITKQTQFRGATITLYALPFLPASPFNPVAHDYRSGLNFVYNAKEMVAAYAAAGRKLPLDIEHNTEGHGRDTRARGWIESLSNAELEPEAGFKPGVLYAWCRLTKLGEAEMLADELYGYTSAVCAGHWLDEDTIQLTLPRSLALTNNPASPVPSAQAFSATLSSSTVGSYTSHLQLTDADQLMLKELLEALGLPADAKPDAALSAVAALKAAQPTAEADAALTALKAFGVAPSELKPGAYVPVVELTAVQTELATLRAEKQEAAIDAAVDAAIQAGIGVPGTRDQLKAVARADVAAFSAMVSAYAQAKPAASTTPATVALSAGAPVAPTDFGLTAAELAICKEQGIKPEYYAAAKAVKAS